MRLELLAKDKDSGEQGCPSVHRDHDSGQLMFLGPEVDVANFPNPLPGEVGLRLDPDIVYRAAQALGWL